MSWSKREIIEQAFNEIGLSGYIFDLSPEQLQTALRQLDSMMAMWASKGIQLGYPVPVHPNDSQLDQDSFVPLTANEAVYLNIGVRIAPGFGKAAPQETRALAKMAYDTLLIQAATPRERQMPETMPRGAGQKPWRTIDNPFVSPPDENPLVAESNGQLTFIGD
jgi:hypothetical protein